MSTKEVYENLYREKSAEVSELLVLILKAHNELSDAGASAEDRVTKAYEILDKHVDAMTYETESELLWYLINKDQS